MFHVSGCRSKLTIEKNRRISNPNGASSSPPFPDSDPLPPPQLMGLGPFFFATASLGAAASRRLTSASYREKHVNPDFNIRIYQEKKPTPLSLVFIVASSLPFPPSFSSLCAWRWDDGAGGILWCQPQITPGGLGASAHGNIGGFINNYLVARVQYLNRSIITSKNRPPGSCHQYSYTGISLVS